MTKLNFYKIYVFSFAILFGQFAYSDLVIEVTDFVKDPIKIAIVPFDNTGKKLKYDISAIVASDLNRSGQFSILNTNDMFSLPNKLEEVYFRDWRALGVDYLLIGSSVVKNNNLDLEYLLLDVYSEKTMLAKKINGNILAERKIAHKISDQVYRKLTGVEGAFSSRLLYVSFQGNSNNPLYRLILSDADGANAIEILRSSEPILSPSWSPDGKDIAYVSFETKRPTIFRQKISDGKRKQITNFDGLNSSPAWSPDGKKIAMVLSKDGNPEVYVLTLKNKKLTRITNNSSIDTEPSWMPDGKSLIFTSDRGGRPQIYKVALKGGQPKRLTFRGNYNARGSVTSDGQGMVMIHGNDFGHHIAWQDLKTGKLIILTNTSLDESPSLAPNDSMILYATKIQGRGVLAGVSLDGGVKFLLPSPTSDVREPAWSP